jgi:phosphocarrier protein HPr
VSAVATGIATIVDPTGLHARPAVQLSKLAKKFACSVEVAASMDGVWINAKSTNSLMKMKAKNGSSIFIRASGEDADSAVSELVELISRNFEAS